MMLRVYFAGRTFGVNICEFDCDPAEDQEIHAVLETLHLIGLQVDDELEEIELDGELSPILQVTREIKLE